MKNPCAVGVADKKKGWMWQSVGLLVALQESGWWALRNHWEILNVLQIILHSNGFRIYLVTHATYLADIKNGKSDEKAGITSCKALE